MGIRCDRCTFFRLSEAEPDMAFCVLDNLERTSDEPYHMLVRSLPSPAKRSVVLVPVVAVVQPMGCTGFRPTRTTRRLVRLAEPDEATILMDDEVADEY